jgi:quercetin dioxygenase-like cupin family protein
VNSVGLPSAPPGAEPTKEVPDLEKPTATSELVSLQSGAVVSRTLLKKPAGTVTVFSFDAGEGLSEHTAPFDALVLGLEGEAEVTIAGEPQTLGAGEILKFPAGRPHSVKAITPFKMLLIMIRA